MKYFLITLFILGFVIACNGQPNTKTTIEVGIVNPQPQKTYLFFADIKADSASSVLVDGMDYLNPNVSSLIRQLQNRHTVADTLFGELEIDDQTYKQFIKPGLVQVNNITQKYSAMRTHFWIDTDSIEPMQAGFFVRKKRSN